MSISRRRFGAAFVSACGIPGTVSRLSAAGTPYGSGSFGEWIEEDGLPAFRYTCDQTHDPKAITSVRPGILSETDHIHQVGNDRLVAIAFNSGQVQVRQDEGAPKILNSWSPERSQFGGGIGYLTGGREVLTTSYPGNGKSFERVFGMGYFRKRVSGAYYSIQQTICAPFGDDPVLLSEVIIENHSDAPASLRWIEYWGCHLYQLSFRAFMMLGISGGPMEQRLKLGDRFAHEFRRMPGGLVESKRFLGRLPEDEEAWRKVKANLVARPNAFLAPVDESVKGAEFDDLNPPATFLLCLDGRADEIATSGKAFFGAGGVARPVGLDAPLDGGLTTPGSDAALLVARRFDLAPGRRRTLRFLYGYGAGADTLARKYRPRAAAVLRDSAAEWKKSGMRFSVLSEPWIARETVWNYYYLRSGLTYDDFFKEHILSQGAVYQYVIGFQGAARDPLQHALPLLFSDPGIVREVLRYTLKEVRADGSIPYGIVGHGMPMPTISDNSSDMPLWLLWAVAEYVFATRDLAFFDDNVRALLARCYRHLSDDVRTGEHSLMRMLNDDWNDALVTVWAMRSMKECVERGESVLNSAMAAYVFEDYARLLDYAGGDAGFAASVRQKAEEHRKAAAAQWTGKWLRRAWLGPTLGWLGESTLWIEPQPWAIIGGITTPEQTRELVRNLDEVLRCPSPIGAMQMGPGPDMRQEGIAPPGESVNGGIWPSLNQTLVWALAMADGKLAWDEWVKNSFARHAAVYPGVWYNTWSGGDVLNSALSKHPGETVNEGFLRYAEFPVMNLHSHACSLYSLTKLLGLEFTAAGVRLAPVIPLEEYRFESPLFGLIKSPKGYEGWYAPLRPGAWTIELNGQKFQGASEPDRPLRFHFGSGLR